MLDRLAIIPIFPSHPAAWNGEFALAVACCRAAAEPAKLAVVAEQAAGVDWGRFVALVERHRIGGLVWRALCQATLPLPAPIREILADDAREITAGNMRAAAQCAGINASFTAAGLPLLFVKGLSLSALAYGDPFIKMSADIDLLVSPRDIAAAAKALSRIGYRCTLPAAGEVQAVAWHRQRKESVWVHERSGMSLDLHSRLADQPELLGGVDVDAPSRSVAITPALALRTLQRDDLFAYLAVHGASSAWFRLKWIADFYALHRTDSPDELARLQRHAQRLGAGRAAGQALLLAARLFGLNLGPELLAVLDADPAHRRLAAMALGQLLGGEPTKRRLGTATIHLSQFLLLPGLSFKGRELVRQVRSALIR